MLAVVLWSDGGLALPLADVGQAAEPCGDGGRAGVAETRA
jgi:hypothetical protein